MGRQVKRMTLGFDWFEKSPGEIWWGYLLGPTPCQSCEGAGSSCVVCEGEGICYPKVEPPGVDVEDFRYAGIPFINARYGWQMWETVTEGSPMSPVCESPEALARWLADNKASAFGSQTATYEQWLAMITGGGWAPSAMIMPGQPITSGVAAFAAQRGKEEQP